MIITSVLKKMRPNFHGGLLDLKYEPRHMRHVCHSVDEHHEPCFIEYYCLYIGRANLREGS